MKSRQLLVLAVLFSFSSNQSSAQALPEQLTTATKLIDSSPTRTLFLPGEDPGALSDEATKLHASQSRDGWELFTIESVYHRAKLRGFFLTYKVK